MAAQVPRIGVSGSTGSTAAQFALRHQASPAAWSCTRWPARRQQHCRRHKHLHVAAQQQGGLGDTLRKAAKQVQASLPVIGLLSRLTAPEGGVGRDMLAYPEYCRMVYEAAPEGFQIAVAELQDRHGRPCQRRYVLCALWMVKLGAGLLPAKDIANAARRLSVSYDLEHECDRFAEAYEEARAKYTYMDTPRPSPEAQAALAVDCLARLCCGLADGEPFDLEDAPLVAAAVVGGLFDEPGITQELAAAAVSGREQRGSAYA